ncbi:MAG: YciI family protein, partial [Acidimicrobiales bacterium]
MKYMCLIYADEHAQPQGADAEALYKAYFAFSEEVVAAGKFVAGDALEPVSTATTVRVRDGQTLTTDGPFAETKEQLGGFYILDCADLDE